MNFGPFRLHNFVRNSNARLVVQLDRIFRRRRGFATQINYGNVKIAALNEEAAHRIRVLNSPSRILYIAKKYDVKICQILFFMIIMEFQQTWCDEKEHWVDDGYF